MARAKAYCQGEELFVQDVYAGADPDYRMQGKSNYRKSMAQFICKKYVSYN